MEEVVDYESDPEEAKLSLKLRRREASDDEDEVSEITKTPLRRVSSSSDNESEGQGAAAEEYEEEEEGEYEEDDDDVAEEVVDDVARGVDGDVAREVDEVEGDGVARGVKEEEEEKPYAVPTAGAFYMHDDRFRDNARGGGRGGRGRGRNDRRTFDGGKLWESKDDWKWGHDKFEELTVEDRHYEEGRRPSRGRYRGRGRAQGAERGTSRGRRPRAYINDFNQNTGNNQKIQNNASRGIRGRGPSRYRPSSKENIDAPPLNKQSGQSGDKISYYSTGKASDSVSNQENDGSTSGKQSFVSSLSYASPPFYPSNSLTKETMGTHKRELQTGTSSHRMQPSLSGKSYATAQSTATLRGKDVSDSIVRDKLKIDDPISAVSRKLPSVNSNQSHPFRGQGRGANMLPHMNYQYSLPNNQGIRVPQPTQLHSTQQTSVQGRGQHSIQQLAQQSGSGSQSFSPLKTGQTVNTLHGELESSSESKLKSATVAKGKGSLQGSGRGSVLYGGAQVMAAPGNMGGGHGDQNATPAYLPVMQFGGQQPGDRRVPAVGMAFPGYVGQPQLGLGNSDMTWLPLLAGAAGALGASYCPPYFAFDGAYHARPSGVQMPSLTAAPSKEDSTSKQNHDKEPQRKNELTSDNSGQRQKNPRSRYTEMKFDNGRVP